MIRRQTFGTYGSVVAMIMLCILFGSPQKTFAQFNSSIEGTVSDSAGAVVSGAQVKLTEQQTGVSQVATTDDNGNFRFNRLPPGQYSVEVSKAGFGTINQQNLRLVSSQALTVPIVLQVGQAQQTVTVTAAPPPIQLDQPKIGGTISSEQLENVALGGRDVFNMLNQVPGVTGIGNASTNVTDNSVFSLVANTAINANGLRGDANSFYIDGTLASSNPDPGQFNLTPNPDSLQEMSVSLNDYSAEYGRSGSVVIRAITRSGANQFHGSLYENHQDNKLTARNEYQNTKNRLTGRYFPAFRRNEYGGSFGGPIQRDKMFFFATVDKLSSSAASTSQSVVETPEFASFMQSNYPNRLATQLMQKYPATRQAVVPGSQQTVASLDTNCATTAPLAGIPCNMPVLETVTNSYSVPDPGLQWSIRGDRYFRNSKERFSATLFRKTTTPGGTNVRQAFAVGNSFPATNATIDYTHTFSPNMLNDAAMGYTRIAGFGLCNDCQVPTISIGGTTGYGNGFAPAGFLQNDFHWRDVLTINHGRHSIRTGADIFRDQENDNFTGPQLRVNYNFINGSPTGLAPIFDFANDQPTQETNINFNQITGAPSSQNIGYRTSNFGFFGQDDIKVSRTLTLNLGLRWDFSSNPYEAHGRLSTVKLGEGSDLLTQIANASVGIQPNVFVHNHIRNFAPRFGFAWDALGNGKLSIRGAIGVFYNRYPNKVWSDQIRNNPPYESSVVADTRFSNDPQPVYGLCASATAPFGCMVPGNLPIGSNPRGGPVGALSSIGGAYPSLKYPYSINRFFGVQYALPGRWVVEADYIGSIGNQLTVNTNMNRCLGCFDPLNNGKPAPPNAYFSAINLTTNGANSTYNGATFVAAHPFASNFSLQASLTIGKTLSEVDYYYPGAGDEIGRPVYNPYNIHAQKSYASFDIPKAFTLNGVYQAPALSHQNPILRAVAGGWQIAPVITLEAGYPYTVQDCNHTTDGAGGCVLPNVLASKRSPHYDRGAFVNNGNTGGLQASYFSLPCPLVGSGVGFLNCPNGRWEGNARLNEFRGPGYATTDLNISKFLPVFPARLQDRAKLKLRGDFFNVFNRVNLQPLGFQNLALNANGVSTNSSFGKSGATYYPRTVQVGMRLQF